MALRCRGAKTSLVAYVAGGAIMLKHKLSEDALAARHVTVPATLAWAATFCSRLDCVCFAGDARWEDDDILRALSLARRAHWSFAQPDSADARELVGRVHRALT